jgi:hypothetical protein
MVTVHFLARDVVSLVRNKLSGNLVDEHEKATLYRQKVSDGLHCLAGQAVRIAVYADARSDAGEGAQAIVAGAKGAQGRHVMGQVRYHSKDNVCVAVEVTEGSRSHLAWDGITTTGRYQDVALSTAGPCLLDAGASSIELRPATADGLSRALPG